MREQEIVFSSMLVFYDADIAAWRNCRNCVGWQFHHAIDILPSDTHRKCSFHEGTLELKIICEKKCHWKMQNLMGI